MIDSQKEFLIPEGCYIMELSNSADDPEVSIARARVEQGVTTRWHRFRGTNERYLILEGNGRVEVGNLVRDVTPGDVVLIPPLCPQRISNTGQKDLIFLAVCTPRFASEVYEEIENRAEKLNDKNKE